MEKLNDIAGYWDMSGNYKFNDTNMWEGKILLDESGWFEGIVKDPNSTYTGPRLVFGIYHPEKIIELLKIAPKNVSDPFIFRGTRDAKGYDGTFSVIGPFREVKMGVAHIITQDAEELHDPTRDIVQEKQELKEQIEAFSQTSDYKELHENTKKIRDSLSQIILHNYQKRGFTRTQAQQINNEIRPINQYVQQKQQEAAKQYVKTRQEKKSSDESV